LNYPVVWGSHFLESAWLRNFVFSNPRIEYPWYHVRVWMWCTSIMLALLYWHLTFHMPWTHTLQYFPWLRRQNFSKGAGLLTEKHAGFTSKRDGKDVTFLNSRKRNWWAKWRRRTMK
jgi:hypothetical protein